MENYCTILTRRDGLTALPQVFLRPGDLGWRLPVFAPQKDIGDSDAKTANALVQEQLGVSVVTRQSLRLPPSYPGGPLNIYIMELRNESGGQNYGGSQSPVTDGSWFGREALSKIEFALPTERTAITAWFDEGQGGNIPSFPLSWWQERWFDTTARWLQTHITGRGGTIRAPVEQVRSACTSALVRVLTDQGYLYLKVIPAPFARKEIALTQMLAEHDPTHFPVVVTAEDDRMLLADFGVHRPLGNDVALSQWEDILRYYAQLQVSSVGSIPRWLSMGCIDLRTERVAAGIDELFARVPERLHASPEQLSTGDHTRLRALAAPLRALCEELFGYGIPDALEHGDLHAGNVAVRESGFLLYDWSHACVTHPFYGFASLFFDDDWFPERPEAFPRLRDAYLESWTRYAPLPRLQEAFALWRRLRPLFLVAHLSQIVAMYQQLLVGQGKTYIAETATGNALFYMQSWLLVQCETLLETFGTREPNA